MQDPTSSLVLSALSLAFNIFANALLVLRFSVTQKHARLVNGGSVLCWIIKVTIALVNLAVFGALKHNQPTYHYSEGFFSAMISVIISGLITLLLIAHWMIRFRTPTAEEEETRVAAQSAIVGIMCLVAILAVEGEFCGSFFDGLSSFVCSSDIQSGRALVVGSLLHCRKLASLISD